MVKRIIACSIATIVIVLTGYLYVNHTDDGKIDIYNDNGTITMDDGTIIDPVDGSVLWTND